MIKANNTFVVALAVACAVAPAIVSLAETAGDDSAAGLVLRAYNVDRVMRKMRDPLPGVLPDRVVVAKNLELLRAEDFAGLEDMFQIMLDGWLTIDQAGEYEFSLEADDGADLTLDGKLVTTDFWKPGAPKPATQNVMLERGRHKIKIRMSEGDGGQGAQLRWRVPGAAEFSLIPASVLSHEPQARVAATQPAAVSPTANIRHQFIYSTRGFSGLKDEQAQVLVDLLEGNTTFSDQARAELAAFLEATRFREQPYWHQTKLLTGFVGSWYSGSTKREPVTQREEFSVSPAVAEKYSYWRSAETDGFKQTITVQGHSIVLFTPAADVVERQSAAEAVAGLPRRYRELIREIRVAPYGTASEFNGGGSTIYIRLRNAASTATLDAAFAHETGHLFQSQIGMYDQWTTAIAADLLSVSEYGRRNPSEDFAEFNRLYISTNDDPEKLESLARIFPNRVKVYNAMLDALNDRATTRPAEK